MATASRHLCRTLIRISNRPSTKRKCQFLSRSNIHPSPFRQLSSTSYCRAASTSQNNNAQHAPPQPDFSEKELEKPNNLLTPADLDADDRAHYETLSKPDQIQYLAVQNHMKAVMESSEFAAASQDEARIAANAIHKTGLNPNFLEERDLAALKDGYWQEDEDDEFGQVPDDDDDFSEELITSVAESELEVHREVREYTRIAAWELPGLLQFTKPYELPDMKKSPLRFRYTTYMGESHPAQRKVVLEFTTKELATSSSLSEAQRVKLIKLLGVRYNPDTDAARMSCEKFENAVQNKRYLGDLVQKLVKEAKDQSDMFEDIPLDFRHHKPKTRYEFPEAWKMGTKEAVGQLEQARQEVRLLDQGEGNGQEQTIDGKELAEVFVRSQSIGSRLGTPMRAR